MKKYIIGILLAMSSVAYAQVSTEGLTQAQIHTLQAQAESMKGSAAKQISTEVREELGAWGKMGTDLGVGLGKAIVSAAKEVGVAANEFANTPLGKIATAVIVYKLVGQDLLGVAFGVVVLVFGLYWTFRLFGLGKVKTYDYIDRPYFWGAFTVRTKYLTQEGPARESNSTPAYLTGLALLVVSLAISSIAIF